MRPKKPFRQQLEDAVSLKFGGAGLERFVYYGTPLEDSQLQDGPQCGMVALSMATSSMPPFVSADLIQREAVERGFSRRGEMFSCNNLCTLANSFLGGSACAQVEPINLLHDCHFLREELVLSRSLLLVPYDTDFNQEPCLKKGHRAHWALIIGAILHDRHGAIEAIVSSAPPENLSHKDLIRSLEAGAEVKLVARQSKSTRLFLFDAEELADSCHNLVEFGRDGGGEDESADYVIPAGGVREGLAGKMVVLRRAS